jgi:hypothetical protein
MSCCLQQVVLRSSAKTAGRKPCCGADRRNDAQQRENISLNIVLRRVTHVK